MVVKTPTAKPNPGHYALAELEKIGTEVLDHAEHRQPPQSGWKQKRHRIPWQYVQVALYKVQYEVRHLRFRCDESAQVSL